MKLGKTVRKPLLKELDIVTDEDMWIKIKRGVINETWTKVEIELWNNIHVLCVPFHSIISIRNLWK